jgi:hypothetical protein
VPIREQEIDALARHFVEGMLAKNQLVAKAPVEELLACVVELMSENFEIEAQIDEEADRMAEAEARKYPGVDVGRLRTMIKQRLAEKKGFTL